MRFVASPSAYPVYVEYRAHDGQGVWADNICCGAYERVGGSRCACRLMSLLIHRELMMIFIPDIRLKIRYEFLFRLFHSRRSLPSSGPEIS